MRDMHPCRPRPVPGSAPGTHDRISGRRPPRSLLAGAIAAACAGALLPACAQTGPLTTEHGPAQLPVVRIDAGIHVIRAELAESLNARAHGLMGRRTLGANEGMLFVFDRLDTHCFWMRNTPLPLSIAFIDDGGRIVDIDDMQPETDDSHCPAQPVRYALEMEQGWFARHGLTVGSVLKLTGRFGPSAPGNTRR